MLAAPEHKTCFGFYTSRGGNEPNALCNNPIFTQNRSSFATRPKLNIPTMSDSSYGTLKQEGVIAQKGKRREEIVDRILEAMSADEIYETLYLQRKSESEVKDRHFRALVDCMEQVYEDLGGVTTEESISERARDSVLWEGNPKTTINNIQFMGVQHRPDFEIQFEDIKIAVEVKLGDKGVDVRGGLGQSIVYAEEFDFVAYLFVDTSKDKKIKEGYEGKEEQMVINSLWENYNIKFAIV